MRNRMLVSLVILLVSSLLLALARPTYACSCVPAPPPAPALKEASAVFAGTVTSVEPTLLSRFSIVSSSADPVQVFFDVSDVWKGNVKQKTYVLTAASGASCGYEFVAGQDYLVYAREGEQGFTTTLCSRTQRLAAATEDLAVFGTGNAPAPGSQVESLSVMNLLLPVVAVVGLMLVVALAVLAVWRRKRMT